jgi:hypothetical protein
VWLKGQFWALMIFSRDFFMLLSPCAPIVGFRAGFYKKCVFNTNRSKRRGWGRLKNVLLRINLWGLFFCSYAQ